MAKKGHLIDAAGLATASRDAGDETPITDVFLRSYVKEPFEGSVNKTKTFKEPMDGFVITNDGESDLSFMINKKIFKVKKGETFSETFFPFTKVVVFTTVPYRAYGVNALPETISTSNVLASDDFERLSTSSLGKTKEGLTWETYASTAPSTNWSIVSGKAKTSGTSFQTAVVDTGMPDYFSVEADILLASGGNAANYGGLMISFADYANNLFFRADGTTGQLTLYIATAAATFAILKQVNFTFTDGQTVKFKATKKGTAIEVFADGVSVLTHTLTDADNSRITSTKQGVFLKSTQGAADNFKAEMLEV